MSGVLRIDNVIWHVRSLFGNCCLCEIISRGRVRVQDLQMGTILSSRDVTYIILM